MTSAINILGIRSRLGPKIWGMPVEFGDEGWLMDIRPEAAPVVREIDYRIGAVKDGGEQAFIESPIAARIIVSWGPVGLVDEDFATDDMMWLHASMSRSDQPPTYEDMKRLHRAVWPQGWAYSVWAPADDHVNFHETTLHLWGRLDGRKCLPNFGAAGMI